MNDEVRNLQDLLGDNYAIERELGGGGMARVFVAEEKRLGRKVVIKVLTRELAAGLSAERFEREVKLAARLQHPHIVPLLAAGEAGDAPFYTMPFVRGESLRSRMSGNSVPPALGEAVPILRQIAAALAYAHDEGVIHRDIKPDNVLISDGFALVADFGIAKAISDARNEVGGRAVGATLTQAGTALGTPAYMAPEQALSDVVDQRADIYSWGVIAYEFLTGMHPFAGKTSAQQFVAAHIAEAAPAIGEARNNLPSALSALIMKALEKNPADRPLRAQEIVSVLEDPALLGATGGGATKRGSDERSPASASGRRAAMMTIAIIAGALLAIGFGGRNRIKEWFRRSTPTIKTAEALVPADSNINTIAVLPFVNTSGDPRDEYFSDGMTDELARALSNVPRLRVAARTSSYVFKGKAATAQEIGRTLHVRGVVGGTVRRSGNRLRVTAQLSNATTGLVVWTDGFERPSANVFQVQDDLTSAIVTALTPHLGGDTAARAASQSRGTSDPIAYDLYLRGRYEWNTRTAKSMKEGIADFKRAIARDPAFARAYAALASSYVVVAPFGASREYPVAKSLELVRLNSSKALALDSSLGEPHAALGFALLVNWKWAESEKEFLRAIALDPNYPTAHQWYSTWLMNVGRLDDALAEIRRARELDPLSGTIAINLCVRAAWVGRLDIASGTCAERTDGRRDGLAVYHMVRSEYDSAAFYWNLNGDLYSSQGLRAYCLAKSGRRAEVQALLRQFESDGEREPLNVAAAYFGLGDATKGFAWLEKSVDAHEQGLRVHLAPVSSRIFEPYRDDPRLHHIVERMGLAQYAKAAWAKNR